MLYPDIGYNSKRGYVISSFTPRVNVNNAFHNPVKVRSRTQKNIVKWKMVVYYFQKSKL